MDGTKIADLLDACADQLHQSLEDCEYDEILVKLHLSTFLAKMRVCVDILREEANARTD